jgi:hypothetical protein
MSTPAIPDSPAAVTPEWLTGVLRAEGCIGDVTSVSEVRVEPIQDMPGLLGQVARLSITYDRAAQGAPRSLVGKFPAGPGHSRAAGDSLRIYEREVRFYRDVAPAAPLATPRCYAAEMDLEDGRFCLLVEDLSHARAGDQLVGCRASDARAALLDLARLHAAWWEAPELDSLDWMPAMDSPLSGSAMDSFVEAVSPFMNVFERRLPPSVRDAVVHLGEIARSIAEHLARPPRTIVHNDFRLDSVFFSRGRPRTPVTVIDWQLSSRGRAAFDLASFLASSLEPAERETAELPILRDYHDVLKDAGVTGYPFEELVGDYRRGLLLAMARTVARGSTLDVEDEGAVALVGTLAERFAAAVDHHRALDLV